MDTRARAYLGQVSEQYLEQEMADLLQRLEQIKRGVLKRQARAREIAEALVAEGVIPQEMLLLDIDMGTEEFLIFSDGPPYDADGEPQGIIAGFHVSYEEQADRWVYYTSEGRPVPAGFEEAIHHGLTRFRERLAREREIVLIRRGDPVSGEILNTGGEVMPIIEIWSSWYKTERRCPICGWELYTEGTEVACVTRECECFGKPMVEASLEGEG